MPSSCYSPVGSKEPTLDKLIQIFGIVLLFSVDLGNSEDMLGKNNATTRFKLQWKGLT